jgi:LysM repeat protein
MNLPNFVPNMRNYFYILLSFVICSTDTFAQQKQTPQEYIEKFKEFAVIEMHRSGVPASITLAQGILESSSGNSRLAKEANNHFGIKCKSTWTGAVIYADDDAPDECFRAYNNALESYKDHSDFLRNNWRYHELFELEITDYKGWAHGLRKAGYATNRQYGTILINLIERYKLYQYDVAPVPDFNKPQLVSDNEIPIVYAEEGDKAESLARENDLSEKQIRKYNDLPQGEFETGDVVYLKPKRRRGTQRYHTVKPGESMRDISQQYGIKLKHLYRRNRLEKGVEVAPGQKLYMRGRVAKHDSLETLSEEEFIKEKEAEEKKQAFINPHSIEKAPPIVKENIDVPPFHVVAQGDNIYRISEKYHILEEDLLEWNGIKAIELRIGQKIYLSKEEAEKHIKKAAVPPKEVQPSSEEETNDTAETFHTVVKGDTVYSICKKYSITADQLSALNNLNNNTIFIGQKLRVK